MIIVKNDALDFEFPEVHRDAKLTIYFQRTLRIPDDDNEYPLPPGLGRFPLQHLDDHAKNLPTAWLKRGGVMFPMFQSEAMWIGFKANYSFAHRTDYPFAVKIAAGKVNAVSGEPWSEGLQCDPQDYVVTPGQPWLDGYNVEEGVVRQFVAMPLGWGYSAEEQITGKAQFGGLQLKVFPMRREAFFEKYPPRKPEAEREGAVEFSPMVFYSRAPISEPMALAPGGRMIQEIYEDDHDLEDWDLEHTGRCFVHILNSSMWQAVTGSRPPTRPPSARQYREYGLPWFKYYADQRWPISGSKKLALLNSISKVAEDNGDVPLEENEGILTSDPIKVGPLYDATL